MKNLQIIARECMKELDAIGIAYTKPAAFTVNTRAQSRWGQCRKRNGTFTINISSRLLQDDVSDTATKDTVIHELLHTVDGCQNHGTKWKSLALKVNRAYPKYNIKTSTTMEEKGIKDFLESGAYKYKVVCKRCNTAALYMRRTNAVTHPERFCCGTCEGQLRVEVL